MGKQLWRTQAPAHLTHLSRGSYMCLTHSLTHLSPLMCQGQRHSYAISFRSVKHDISLTFKHGLKVDIYVIKACGRKGLPYLIFTECFLLLKVYYYLSN